MGEPFDIHEARRLIYEAHAVESELTDVTEMGRKIDAEIRDGKLTGDREAKERAYAENDRLAKLCTRCAFLWDTMACGLDSREISVLRAAAEAIRRVAEDEFRRSWEGGDAQRYA